MDKKTGHEGPFISPLQQPAPQRGEGLRAGGAHRQCADRADRAGHLADEDVPGLIATAKAQPGKLNYTSGGSGTSVHLAAELFESITRSAIVHIPTRAVRRQ